MRHTHATLLQLLPLLAGTAAHAGDQSPALPAAVIDLRTTQGAAMVGGTWRFADAAIVDADFNAPGPDLKPSGPAVKTHTISPRLGTPEFDRAPWATIAPEQLEARRTNGRLAFAWYTIDLTIPANIADFSTAGAAATLELVVDDYAEVWVDGHLPLVLGQHSGPAAAGWNAPVRVPLAPAVMPGQQFHIAIFAANGPLSDPPPNYVWVRSATLDFDKPAQTFTPVQSGLTRLDPAFDAIVSPGAKVERLAQGFSFTEGPVWIPATDPAHSYGGGGLGNYLLFSDPNKNVIHRFDPASGDVSIFRTKSGYSGLGGANIGEYHQPGSNGLALSPDHRLAICEHGNRRVTRLEPNGTITVLADRYQGHRLNSPNDLVYRSDGTLFFTDPPFGLPKVYDDPRKELDFSGVYALVNGQLRLLTQDLKGPNGLAFSPDESHLYVDNWDEHRKVIIRYDVAADATLSNPVTFVDLTASDPGEICFDGLKVDASGNVYASAPGGIRVYSPEGKHLGTISPPELPANFAFGDADAKTLYMTARTGLYRVRVETSGRAAR